MKKFYSFLLMATALLISGNIQAIEVSDLAGLKAALSSGGDITLTANIETNSKLIVSQITTINGNGYCIKGNATAAATVMEITSTGKVEINNIVIYAAQTNGVGILIQTDNTNVTLNNVTINTKMRGMNVWNPNGVAYSTSNVTLTINDSKFQLVPNGGGTEDATTGMPATDNYNTVTTAVDGNSYSRGLNLGRLINSNITVNNSTIQGFFYNVNIIGGTMEGTKVVCNNSTFKGRAAYNIWSYGGYYEVNDCDVLGLNNFGGGQESFACFVINKNTPKCENNTLIINGGTLVGASFNGAGEHNEYARQYLATDRQGNNTIQINNAQYTCDKTNGDNKGGLFEQVHSGSTIEVNGGIYDCPNIIEGSYSDSEGNTANVSVNGGTFDVNVVSPDMTDGDLYSALEINAGNFEIATGSLTDADPNNAENTLLGENMAVAENVDGTKSVMPAAEAAKVEENTFNEDINIEEDKEVYTAQVAAGKTITVKEGQTFTIDKGGLLFENNESKVVVEDGGTLVLKGNVNGNGDENSIVIETSEGSNTSFLIAPDVNVYLDEHPQGTFKFKSKSYMNNGKQVWQRFGVPTYDGITTMTWDNTHNTRIFEYDYNKPNGGAWSALYEGKSGSYDFVNKEPFACFNMATTDVTSKDDVIEYTFTGSLMGNQDAQLNLVKDWNFLANSYTAPIDIYEFMQDVLAKSGKYVSATAYIYRAEDNWWDMVNLGDFEINALLGDEVYPVAQKKIKPMQAFVLKLVSGTTGTTEISYENNVYNPALGIANAGAPRRAAADNIDAAIRMSINNGEYTDNMTLIEGYNFSEAFDNGFDAQKFMNNGTHNLYAMTMDGNMGAVATNNLEGTVMSFKAAKAGNYTISFDAVMNANYALKDMKTNAVINIEKGATYSFNAEAGEEEGRFAIIGRADAPTGVDEAVNVVKGQEGIYTITGVYVGEKAMLNTLPAGVYVVDGKKIVK